MIDENEYSNSVSEVLEILKYVDDEIIEKIPLEVIKNLKQQKSPTYNPGIDFIKNLKMEDLKKETLVILATLYRDYICEEEERKEIDRMLQEKSELRNKDLNTFKQVAKTESNELVKIEQKKSLWQKITEKFLKWK